MKKTKIFAKIVYYVFTFSLGIVLAFVLPYYYFEMDSPDEIRKSLESGNYSDAMLLVGGYFNKQPVFQKDFPQGGIVLFEAASLIPSVPQNEDEKPKDDAQLHCAYTGFVYGVKDVYEISAASNNQSKMIVTCGDGTTKTVAVLDHDSDNDKIYDTNATCSKKGFFYVDLDKDTFGSLRKLQLVDKDGNVFAEVDLELNYTEAFFMDIGEFVEEYNRDYKSDKLEALDKAFREKNEDYTISSTQLVKSHADKKAAIIVVSYFLGVYILADFILGSHYIIKFFRWFLYKVCKIKPKQKAPKYDEAFGHDYFSKVTFALDVSAVENFNQGVKIRYNDENGEEISFLLLKENNYSVTERVKAGTYVNLWIDLDKNVYATQNLPETLIVEGYQKGYKIKIIKREE